MSSSQNWKMFFPTIFSGAGVLVLSSLIIYHTVSPAQKEKIQNIPLVKQLLRQRWDAKRQADIITLNHQLPEFAPWAKFILSDKKDRDIVPYFMSYYKQVNRVFPQLADGYAMLGFCAFYVNKPAEALEYYQKAAQLNPRYFYFYYNMGLIYLQQARYEEAQQMFEQALRCDPKKTIENIYSSRVYVQIIGEVALADKNKIARLEEDYKAAAKYLAVSRYCVENKIKERARLGVLDLKVF